MEDLRGGPPTTHRVDIAQKIKFPGLCYCLHPQERFRRAVFAGVERLDKHYEQAGGRFTAHERRASSLEAGLEPAGSGCTPGTMAIVQRVWRAGDVVTLDLPMEISLETRFDGSAAVRRGPLHFALRVGADYSDPEWVGERAAGRIREHTGFPIHDRGIRLTTPWNYALVVDRRAPRAAMSVRRRPPGDFPFAQKGEPVFRKLPARDGERFDKAPFRASARDAEGRMPPVAFERQIYAHEEPVVVQVKGRLVPDWSMLSHRGPDAIETPTSAANPPASPVAAAGPEVAWSSYPMGARA